MTASEGAKRDNSRGIGSNYNRRIRARISKMPWRCKQLVKTGSKGIKTELW